MKTRGILRSIAVAFFVLTLLVPAAFAVPQTINYQGELADSGGTPIDGTVSMVFAIYNAPTGGTALWSETQGSVAVTDGAFSVALGSITPITLAFDTQYYLGVNVGGDGEMTPRAALASVPYAMRANVADTADALEGYTLNDIIALLDGRYRLRLVLTTVDSAGNVGVYASIAIGADGLPVISYLDNTNLDLKVAHCGDAACTSGNTINTVDAAGFVGYSTSIAIGADGWPVVSYYDGTNLDLKVAHCGDASCSTGNTITTVDSTGNAGIYTSIAVGADGLPVISYWDNTNRDLKVAHCGDASCTPATNTINIVDAGNAGWYTSIAIGADGLPVVSYQDNTNYDLKVAHCGDASCSTGNTITTVDSAGDVGRYTSIAIGADGLPVISYWDNTNRDLKVLHCGDTACSTGNTITTVDSVGDVGEYASIAIGADGLPVVSYLDDTNDDLKVAHCGDVFCSSGNTIKTVDSAGIVGRYTSIAIGADGLPVISYWDTTNRDLKVAHCGDYACTLGF